MLYFRATILLGIILLGAAAIASPVTVQTLSGPLQGTAADGISSFLGVPYAQPPKGPLRWRPPQPVMSWTAPRAATQFGSVCPQTENYNSQGKVIGDEDCLTLNVWAPLKAPAKKLPVIVFLHGGAGFWGSSGDKNKTTVLYDGQNLARRGAVVVTLNYRLGAFGFFFHPFILAEQKAESRSGNFGFMDQQLALKWVHDNASAFGGDPQKALLFGQSAGAYFVGAHLSAPSSKGLFTRALIESGGDTALDIKTHTTMATQIGGADCKTSECLRKLTPETIIRRIPHLWMWGMFGAVPDGTLIPLGTRATFEQQKQNVMPTVVGSTAMEFTTMFWGMFVGVPMLTPDHFKTFLEQRWPKARDELYTAYLLKALTLPYISAINVMSDTTFLCPTRRMARALTKKSPTYRYLFSHAYTTKPMSDYGAGHGIDLPLVWGNIPADFNPTAAEKALSKKMGDLWVRFADTGTFPKGPADKPIYHIQDTNDAFIAGYREEYCDQLDRLRM